MDFYSHGRFRHREKERSTRSGGGGGGTRKGYFIIVRETRARWFRGNTRFKIMPDVSPTFTWNYIAERVPFDELASCARTWLLQNRQNRSAGHVNVAPFRARLRPALGAFARQRGKVSNCSISYQRIIISLRNCRIGRENADQYIYIHTYVHTYVHMTNRFECSTCLRWKHDGNTMLSRNKSCAFLPKEEIVRGTIKETTR